MNDIETTIGRYISKNNQVYQRYNSWNHCYKAFGNITLSNDNLALNLGFYLASWGMYRGSSKLLECDYLVHVEAVRILKENYHLRCNQKNEVTIDDIGRIHSLIENLSSYYKEIHSVTPTDTLISKIILGTLGCLPAFDRFFNSGVKSSGNSFNNLKIKNLSSLFQFIEDNHLALNKIKINNPQYPIMKLVDMYFWQIGFEENN